MSTKYDSSLPQGFFDRVSGEPTCPHPWQWFCWAYPEDGPMLGLPAAKTVEAVEWCQQQGLECYTGPMDYTLPFSHDC
jgi:hypothetical protein